MFTVVFLLVLRSFSKTLIYFLNTLSLLFFVFSNGQQCIIFAISNVSLCFPDFSLLCHSSYILHMEFSLSLLRHSNIICVMILALGSQPWQGHENLQVESATWESHSHSHSQECERMRENEPTHSQVDSHFGSWNPYGVSNIQRTI